MRWTENNWAANRTRLLAGVLILAMGVLLVYFLRPGTEYSNEVLIGVSDDAGGLVVDYLIRNQDMPNRRIKVEQSLFKDCCSSSGEWALGSGRLDLALLCPDAAARLVARDKRYEIVGPCLVNSDILVVRSGIKPKKIGITQNRWYQKRLALKQFKDCQVISMLPGALPYAYEKGVVDGVVVDVGKGLYLKGQHHSINLDGKDTVTSVLVVSKKFKQNPSFQRLMVNWNNAVEELNRPAVLQQEINAYYETTSTDKEAGQWKEMGVQFTQPTQ
ncbi:MAG: ABC transporter substrate-binding (seleno)protein SaoB [Chitinophagales bacterium]